MSGVAASFCARVIIAPVMTPMASGPRRCNTNFRPMRILPKMVRRSSLVVIGLVHL